MLIQEWQPREIPTQSPETAAVFGTFCLLLIRVSFNKTCRNQENHAENILIFDDIMWQIYRRLNFTMKEKGSKKTNVTPSKKKCLQNRKTMTSWDDSYLRSVAQRDNGPTIWITWFGLDPCMANIFRATFLCHLTVKCCVAVTNRFVTCSLVQTYIHEDWKHSIWWTSSHKNGRKAKVLTWCFCARVRKLYMYVGVHNDGWKLFTVFSGELTRFSPASVKPA